MANKTVLDEAKTIPSRYPGHLSVDKFLKLKANV